MKDNEDMWGHVHGIAPERLFRPTSTDIELARQASNRLLQLAETDGRDGLVQFAQEAEKGVGMLASLEWEDIRIERFSLTPPGIYSELVRLAENLLYRQAAEAIRRQKWLTRQVGDSAAHEEAVPAVEVVDKHKLDLSIFKNKTGKRPKDWNKACQIASWVCIDEMPKPLRLLQNAIAVKPLKVSSAHQVLHAMPAAGGPKAKASNAKT